MLSKDNNTKIINSSNNSSSSNNNRIITWMDSSAELILTRTKTTNEAIVSVLVAAEMRIRV